MVLYSTGSDGVAERMSSGSTGRSMDHPHMTHIISSSDATDTYRGRYS